MNENYGKQGVQQKKHNNYEIWIIDSNLYRVGWVEKQKMWNINCSHADSVDIHKTEGSYISSFNFNTIGDWAFTKISFFSSGL